MNITSQQKKGIIAGILAIIVGGGAFAYFDPLDLDLLGLKEAITVAQPVAKPHTAAPAAVPKAASAPIASSAPVVASAPVAESTPVKVAVPVVSTPASAPVAASATDLKPPKSDQTIKPATKLAKDAGKPATGKSERARDLDLRHCLELENNAAIAKCAGE